MLFGVCICSKTFLQLLITNGRFPLNIYSAHTQTRQTHILQMQGNHGKSKRTDFSS